MCFLGFTQVMLALVTVYEVLKIIFFNCLRGFFPDKSERDPEASETKGIRIVLLIYIQHVPKILSR